MSISEQYPNPVYTGVRKYIKQEDGWGIWYPTNWRVIEMTGDHKGVIFAPFPDTIDTCLAVEKHILPMKVKHGDAPVLKKGLEDGLKVLPGIEIDEIKEDITTLLLIYDAKFSFEENGQRRKRWLRNVYWGEGQLVIIAQGATPKDYEFWMPVFFNSIMTLDLLGNVI